MLLTNDVTLSLLLKEQIKVFSNYNDGLLTFGEEEVVTDYVELSEDPKGEWIRSSKPCFI